MPNTTARGPRITAEPWQYLLGVGGASSPGPKPVEKRTSNPCDRCGKAYHAHDKERVSDGNGRFYYEYLCP